MVGFLKRFAVGLTAALAVFAMSDPAQAQKPELGATGTGARSRGMGKAFLAVSDDATAISWNPAGLVQLERPEISAVGLLSAYRNSLSGSTGSGTGSKNYGYIDFGSIAYPTVIGEKAVVFALAYQRQSDITWAGSIGTTSVELGGGVQSISPAIAVQVQPQFWIGAALNLQYVEAEISGAISQAYHHGWAKNRTLNVGIMADMDKTRLGLILRTRVGGRKASLPLSVGGGLAYRPNDELTVAGDLEYAKWSDYNDYDQNIPTEDTFEARVGIEYVRKTDFGGVPIRGGIYTAKSPLGEAVNGRFTGDQPMSFHITLGVGAAMEKGSVDFAYDLGFQKTTDDYGGGARLENDIKHHRFIVSAVIYLNQ